MKTAPTRTIGQDKGYGDIFLATVNYADGSIGAITVYGRNIQSTHALLETFASVWGYTVISIS